MTQQEKPAAIPVEAVELMTMMMQHNSDANFFLVEGLMKGYRADARRYRITLEVLREQINDLFAANYMPTPGAVLRIVYDPSWTLIEERIAAEERLDP